MEPNSEGKLLRIYLSNTDKFKHTSLSDALVFAAKRYGLAGATVLRGSMGFGSSNKISAVKLWEITEKVPLVIEIVDEGDKIDHYLGIIMPWFDKIKTGCLITTESIHVVLYKKGK